MAEGPIELHEIPYKRLFPWVRLFRAFGMATDPKQLILAAVGLVVVHLGWSGIDHLFSRTEPTRPPWPSVAEIVPEPEVGATSYPVLTVIRYTIPSSVMFIERLKSAPWRLTEPFRVVVGPFVTAFDPENSRGEFVHAALAAFWGAIVWGLIGGAIARGVVLQAARSERLGLRESLRFAVRRGVTLAGTPLSPLLGIFFFTVLCAAFGLVFRVPGVGPIVAGVFLFLPLLAGVAMAVILIGLAIGWPLMPAAIAAEEEDGFDAVSRTYAYVNQRRGHYLGYVVLAWLIGIAGLIFVDVFAAAVVQLTHWALGFGAPSQLFRPESGANVDLAAKLRGFWLGGVGLFAHGWIYSYFWTSASIIYLLLRCDVDGTPFDEVRRNEAEANPFEMPLEPATVPPAAETEPN